MKKNVFRFLSYLVVISMIFPLKIKAGSDFSNENEVINFVQAAFQAQVDIGEQPRTMEEINELLSPFLTKEYQTLFLNENLHLVDDRYITYGTDFPLLYIPFFSYSDKTKVVWDHEKIYVIEFFSENDEGPVSYNNHYEGVSLEKNDNSWKVAAIYYDNIPEQIIQQSNGINKLKHTLNGSSKGRFFQKDILSIPYIWGYSYIRLNPIFFMDILY
ncbi:DUF3993 domain-containing protein [Cytobacillus dafuensis]|uniref:DUF3993 domain-containing protein n=1 Tax=Cytobacillus dafuensis TaxID=1742359 RepID=A0A5B8Z5C0_CYTDA|nr:DUF3993 domain-containing protein [Cytobacillus dafuensis]QED47353.1 DUF3993 domain-containing protein [Cytobacillus dafuensis]